MDALNPIGRLGANIVAVIHQRDVKTERGTVPVQITIEGDKDTLNEVLNLIEETGIEIIEVDGILRKEKITTILVGNIVDQDLKDTVNLLNKIEGVMVADPEKSASRIVIEAQQGRKKEVLTKIKDIGNLKGFLVINEV